VGSGRKSDQPNFGRDDSDPDNGGGFVNLRHDHPGRVELAARYAARLHALDTRDEAPVWCCPQDDHVIAEIGLLTGP
jgi:hypothetical protein